MILHECVYDHDVYLETGLITRYMSLFFLYSTARNTFCNQYHVSDLWHMCESYSAIIRCIQMIIMHAVCLSLLVLDHAK